MTAASAAARLETTSEAVEANGGVCRRLELEVNADFHLLDVAIEFKPAAAGKPGKRFVGEPKKVILEFRRPIGRQGIFEAGADQPHAVGIGGGDRGARRQLGKARLATDPAAPHLDVNEGAVQSQADTAGERADPFDVGGRLHRPDDAGNADTSRGIDRRPIKIPFNAQDKIANLKVVADLDAADEASVVPVKADAR